MEIIQQRDARGHFASKIEPDTELAAKWAEDKRRADLAAQVLGELHFPLDLAGIVRNANGNSAWMTQTTTAALMGSAFGIAYGNRTKSTKKIAKTIAAILAALDMKESF